MTLYQLTGGNHEQGGKTYVKGDTIETDRNLTSLFRGKFRRVHPDEVLKPLNPGSPELPGPKSGSSPKAEAGAGEKPESESAGDGEPASVDADKVDGESGPELIIEKKEVRLGPDVTASFVETKGTGFKVHKTDDKYHVVDGTGAVSELLTRDEAIIFINSRN